MEFPSKGAGKTGGLSALPFVGVLQGSLIYRRRRLVFKAAVWALNVVEGEVLTNTAPGVGY